MEPQPPEPVAVLSRRGQERGAAENGAPRAGPSPVRQEHTVIIEPRPGSKDEEEDAGSEPETGDPEEAAGCGEKAWLYPELPWGAPPEWDKAYMRGANFLAVWEIVTFVCCLYVAVSVPYNVTFAEMQENLITQGGGDVANDCVFKHLDEFRPMRFWLSIADLVVDGIFYVDILFNFHVAVWEISKDGSPHWVLIDDLPSIRRRYLRQGFLTDIVGQIPWQYSDCFLEGLPIVKILRLFRLLKLLRLHRLKRMIVALYRKFPSMELFITGLELLVTESSKIT
jgi:hypothetical protein